MINLYYSEDFYNGKMTGPKKVIDNLLRSLKDCHIEYSVNEEVYDKTLFLQWNPRFIEEYKKLKNKKNLLVGPQIWAWSEDIKELIEYHKVILPSKWCENSLNKFFPEIKTCVWPVAIYEPSIKNDIKTDCLVYYKNRSEEDLLKVLNYLESKNISYTGLQYGNYTQQEFLESLSEVKYCIIIDNTESQGIAIQEMMAANKPLFVWNQTIWDYLGPDYIVEGTSIPYWSSKCGEYIDQFENFDTMFNVFLENIDKYSPKEYINEELSPQKSINKLLNLFP